MKTNKEKREKLNNYVRQKYGDDAYDLFLKTLSRPPHISPPAGDHVLSLEISVQNPTGKINLKTTGQWIDKRWEELKEKYGRGNKESAYNELVTELQKMGVSLKKNNIDLFDYVKFDAAYRQRKNRK